MVSGKAILAAVTDWQSSCASKGWMKSSLP